MNTRADQSCVLAADLGGTKLSVALVERSGRLFSRQTVAVDHRSSQAPVDQMVSLAGELCRTNPNARMQAAGIAIPGLVRRNGTVWAPNLPGWEHLPLARLLSNKLRLPVLVESDRNAAVLGEAWRGAAAGKTDVIVLIVGTGIGAGILSSGRLLRGAHELSGCAGWMIVSDDETAQSKRAGSLESLTAGPGIAARARQKGAPKSQALTAAQLAEAARRGDRDARKIFLATGRLLGRAVANLVSLFDPQVVVLSGGLAGAADLYFEELKRVALSRCQPIAALQVKIRISKLGERANLLGAASIAFEQLDAK